MTSLDNPLRTAANDPAKGNPFYEKRGVTAAQAEQSQVRVCVRLAPAKPAPPPLGTATRAPTSTK